MKICDVCREDPDSDFPISADCSVPGESGKQLDLCLDCFARWIKERGYIRVQQCDQD